MPVRCESAEVIIAWQTCQRSRGGTTRITAASPHRYGSRVTQPGRQEYIRHSLCDCSPRLQLHFRFFFAVAPVKSPGRTPNGIEESGKHATSRDTHCLQDTMRFCVSAPTSPAIRRGATNTARHPPGTECLMAPNSPLIIPWRIGNKGSVPRVSTLFPSWLCRVVEERTSALHGQPWLRCG